ncbi:MAG: hypothetical protein ACP6IQ_01795 [Candidatus Njordarchaeia archaeon]
MAAKKVTINLKVTAVIALTEKKPGRSQKSYVRLIDSEGGFLKAVFPWNEPTGYPKEVYELLDECRRRNRGLK